MHETIWKNCLDYIKDRIPHQSLKTWFEPINPIKIDGNVLTIQVPSQFFYEWLEENYVHVLKEAVENALGSGARLEYSVVIKEDSKPAKPASYMSHIAHQDREKAKPGINSDSLFLQELKAENTLNPTYLFENFIEGDCNRLARSAGFAVAKKPGVTSFNPLMIYGGVGLGKTHLVQAIGNEIKSEIPEKKILYVASEKFTNQFIDALKNNSLQGFIAYYREVDVLILDDIQFLRDKEKTREKAKASS